MSEAMNEATKAAMLECYRKAGYADPEGELAKVMTSRRFDYVKYDEVATALQGQFKTAFQALEGAVATLNSPRAVALATTKLEEAYMWVGKAIRDDQVARCGGAELQEGRNNS